MLSFAGMGRHRGVTGGAPVLVKLDMTMAWRTVVLAELRIMMVSYHLQLVSEWLMPVMEMQGN